MTSRELLEEVIGTLADRGQTYGDADTMFDTVAELWSALFRRNFTAADVALAMTALKMARLRVDPQHQDSWIDAAGYLALGGSIATQ